MRQATARSVLVGTTFAWVLIGVPSCLIALVATLFFDDPRPVRWAALIVLTVDSFPIACIVAVVRGWQNYRVNRFTAACRWACLPLVNLIAFGVLEVIVSVARHP
jgi:hypothetical protein